MGRLASDALDGLTGPGTGPLPAGPVPTGHEAARRLLRSRIRVVPDPEPARDEQPVEQPVDPAAATSVDAPVGPVLDAARRTPAPVTDTGPLPVHPFDGHDSAFARLPLRPAPAPVAPAPVVAECVVAEPMVAESTVAESTVAEPVVAEPVVARRVVAEPMVTEPVVDEPVVDEPGTVDPRDPLGVGDLDPGPEEREDAVPAPVEPERTTADPTSGSGEVRPAADLFGTPPERSADDWGTAEWAAADWASADWACDTPATSSTASAPTGTATGVFEPVGSGPVAPTAGAPTAGPGSVLPSSGVATAIRTAAATVPAGPATAAALPTTVSARPAPAAEPWSAADADRRPVAVGLADGGATALPPLPAAGPAVTEEAPSTTGGVLAEAQPAGGDVLPGPETATLRDAVFGAPRDIGTGPMTVVEPASATVEPPALPEGTPALACDGRGRIVRVNLALLDFLGVPAAAVVTGLPVERLLTGPDTDARVRRADGGLRRVRVVRWNRTGSAERVLGFVELPAQERRGESVDHRRMAELERLAGIGTWSYELTGDAGLVRGHSLTDLYRRTGVVADGPEGPIEHELVNRLVTALRAAEAGAPGGVGDPSVRRVELRTPTGGVLACRAEVERDGRGRPARVVGLVRDVTVSARADERVRNSARRFADLMALVPSGVALFAPNGLLLDANEGLAQMLDAPVEWLRGMPASALTADGPLGLTSTKDGAPLPGWLADAAPGRAHRVDAAPLLRRDGTTVWCEVSATVTTDDAGGWCWLVVATDVGERRRAAELLRHHGTVDELTRLPNRAATLTMVDRLLSGPGRDQVAVVCGDLDDFARVNSSLGHEAGDDLLVTLAGRLQRELPVTCTAARLSGDEFVVICADHTEVGGPDQLARLVADLLRTTVTVHGRPVPMTATVGLATPVPSGDVRAADLLRFAEVAMQDAKRRQARGGIGMATDGVVGAATQALELEAELRAAIEGTGLILEYQPVVGPDGTVVSAEALVRWRHPERGTIPPGEFLPVAQRSGLLRELDLWVLRTATAEAAGWPEHQGAQPSLAVNLAGLLPGDAGFLAAVTDVVESSGLAWDRLVLELVETSLVALPPHALAAMALLTDRGVRFAVDDFGTGYSSLARLTELPAQTVKVDRAFVTGIADDPAAFAVARAVVDMAAAMGRRTVAEGVETAEQFHVLRGIGVDAYQGWLFAKPLPPEGLRDVLAGGRLPTPAENDIPDVG